MYIYDSVSYRISVVVFQGFANYLYTWYMKEGK